MEDQHSSAAPDCSSVLQYVGPIVWRAKWLIGGATIVVAAVAFALSPVNAIEAWSGRAILRLGLVPTAEHLLLGGSAPLAVIDLPRNVAAMLSDPEFRHNVVSRATFQPASEAVSRSMVASSLRATVLESDRNVAVELSAGSPADIEAAYRAVSEAIIEIHGKLLNERLALLDTRIDDAKSRIASIQDNRRKLDDRVLSAITDDKMATHSAVIFLNPDFGISIVNELQDRIEQANNLKALSEPTVLRLESNNYLTGSRSVGNAEVLAVGRSLNADRDCRAYRGVEPRSVVLSRLKV